MTMMTIGYEILAFTENINFYHHKATLFFVQVSENLEEAIKHASNDLEKDMLKNYIKVGKF